MGNWGDLEKRKKEKALGIWARDSESLFVYRGGRKMKKLKSVICILLSVALLAGGLIMFDLPSMAADRRGGSKKGLQIEFGMMSDVEELGISEAFLNIVFEKILSLTATDYAYTYGGTTYYFNKDMLEQYDKEIDFLNDMGANITVAFLNQYASGFEYLLYTGAGRTGTIDYGFNTKDAAGRNAVAAVAHFVANRYKGKVSRYVIGNEVNDNATYNWVGEMDISQYVAIYYDTFKVFSDSIKAEDSSALLYIPLEHRWNTENGTDEYAGKDFLNRFNTLAKSDSVDWNVAYHPYSYPISRVNPLEDGKASQKETGEITYGGEVDDTEDSPLITMKNIHVLTDYMQKTEMLNASGQVRSIIISEVGYSSTSNLSDGSSSDKEVRQAAAIAYGYYAAEMNEHIDAFILHLHADTYVENEYLCFGLRNASGSVPGAAKTAYYMYKYIDTADSLSVTSFAPKTLGVGSWTDALSGFDGSRFSTMKSIDNGNLYKVSSLSSQPGVTVLSEGMANATTDGQTDSVTDIFWNPSYNVHTISPYDFSGTYYNGLGTAVVDENAYAISAQSVEHTYDTSQDFSSTPYLGFKFKAIPKNNSDSSDILNVRVRVYSAAHVYDANANVTASDESNLVVDLSSWSYKNAVDKVSIWITEANKSTSYSGVITVYDFSKMTSLSGAEKLSVGKDTAKPSIAPIDKAMMYRLYNPNSGEHFYTGSIEERTNLIIAGWNFEGNGWEAPLDSGYPVYRLYNPNAGDHHYTTSSEEKDDLVGVGWQYEGIAWNSATTDNRPLYRLYNPNAQSGAHHYTMSEEERDNLVSIGWQYEGIGWFGL